MTYSAVSGGLLAALAALILPALTLIANEPAHPNRETGANANWAEIRVLDVATGCGIPLVELETVNNLRFVTDNAGRVAFQEPGLMGREIFFTVRSHGYEIAKDGFGFAGARVIPQVGKLAEIKLTRQNVAERLCRLTGEGLYRDSRLLGHQPPLVESPHPGNVAGQDSVQAVVHRGKVFWFWGDTSRMNYPLGLFRVAGATTPVPDPADRLSDPAGGISYDYFTDPSTGFVRAMLPRPEHPQGVIWVESVFVVPDQRGLDRLVGHYSRRKGLTDEYEHGIAIFNDDQSVFEPARQLPLTESWRRPRGHPIVYEEDGTRWLLFGSPNPNVRIPATLEAVLDLSQYQAFTFANVSGAGKSSALDVGADGKPAWRWQQDLPPIDSKTEQLWVKEGKLKAEHARFLPADAAAPAERVLLHSGSVKWNKYRQRWVLVACQLGGKSSLLGEVWYAEATAPTGPFATAVKILTHDRQTFYNVCQHSFLDRDGGRSIHFEGTYTNEFSGNPEKTPRYNYNQILYRLDLDAGSLHAARVK